MSNPIEVANSNDAIMTSPEPGLRRQVMSFTPNMMLVRHRMVKGWVGAKHSHPHEQMVYVVSGRIVLETPDGQVEAGAGDSFIVSGGVEHQAWALENSEVLDMFTPYREDYAPVS
jgi:quercetin dioxygenase-like cupin family protein